jgi:NAD(P)-dependent dehydrogenase (short-subunit alcohol dehydrogenase family)
MELQGARVLVTGASTGIGAALAVALGGQGATVGLLARRGELLDDVLAQARAAGAGAASRRWAVDLGDLDAAGHAALDAWDAFGGLDAFVSNAALLRRRHATAVEPAELDEHMRVNFSAPAHMVLGLLPRMVARGSGTIVMVGSVAGRIGAPGELCYVSSKHALAGFTETLAADTLHTGLTVRLVTPGPFDTPIWQPHGGEPTHYTGPRFPPSVAADTILAVLRGGTSYETFVPEQAAATVARRNQDVDAFIARAAQMGLAVPSWDPSARSTA